MTGFGGEVTREGRERLGECIAYWRKRPKPWWTPPYKTTAEELDKEREEWSQMFMAWIVMKCTGQVSGDKKEDEIRANTLQSQIQRLELGVGGRGDGFSMVIWIAALQICRSPKTKEPYTLEDLISIMDGTLDWRTGKRLN